MTSSDQEWWFDASALTTARRGLLARLPFGGDGADEAFGDFARDNGLVVDEEPVGDLPSLVLAGRRRSTGIVRFVGDPAVEFANHGSRANSVTDDFLPPRMGYIAVRHGLALPHVVASFQGLMGAKTAANVATATLAVLGSFNPNSRAPQVSRLRQFSADGVRLSVGEERPSLTTADGDEARARELLTPVVRAELAELTESFAVEIRDEWVLAYSFFGDVTTTDPEVWAWVFSSASRLIDLVALWREGWPPVDAGVLTRALDLREIPFYTTRRLPRPSRLDGVLSRSTLDRLKR